MTDTKLKARLSNQKNMDISFIILTWNSKNYVERCLASIDDALERTNLTYEVLVLDNGSRDGTPDILKQLAFKRPDVIIPFFEPENIGTTKSRNILLSAARGKYLCVMDSDVELRLGVLEAPLSVLTDNQQLGIVVPSISYPSGAWQKSFDRFPTLIEKINRFIHLRSIEKRESFLYQSATQPFFVDYAISAFWLMRRDILEKVGFLDERIFYSPEDVDFCLRVWKSGFKILYLPSVSIIHHTQEISRGWKLNSAKLSHIKGLFYLFFKHRYFFRRPYFCHSEESSSI
jgi:GT2 family glycosyltransferase